LKSAIAIALPDGQYLPFAENYQVIKKLLPDAGCDSQVQERIAALATTLEKGLAAFRSKVSLTPREKEVLQLLQEGLSNQEIADRLNVSFSTARATVSNVLKKKGVTSRELLKDTNTQK
jgi:LuxR family maltose regulon positive regulatory protein